MTMPSRPPGPIRRLLQLDEGSKWQDRDGDVEGGGGRTSLGVDQKLLGGREYLSEDDWNHPGGVDNCRG